MKTLLNILIIDAYYSCTVYFLPHNVKKPAVLKQSNVLLVHIECASCAQQSNVLLVHICCIPLVNLVLVCDSRDHKLEYTFDGTSVYEARNNHTSVNLTHFANIW